MSGPDTITIQVDNSGALTAIAGTAEAINQLGEAARAAAGQFQAISQAESPFQTMLGQLSATIPVLADANSLLGDLTNSLSGLAAPFVGQAAAATTATAATNGLRVVMNSLPLLAVAGAVATLGVGLYELWKNSSDSAVAFKDMDSALRALSPILGTAGQGLDDFAARVDKASASRRKLMELGLVESMKAGQAELKQQADTVKELFEEVYGVAAVRGRGSRGEKLVDDAGLAAYREFLKSGDLEELTARLSEAGGKARELFATVVETDDGPRSLLALASASVETREKLDLLGQQMRVVRGEVVAAVSPQNGQAAALRDAGEASVTLASCQQELAQQTRAAAEAAREGMAAAGLQAQGAALMADALATSTRSMAASMADFDTQLQADFQKSLIGQAELDKAAKAKTDAAAAAAKAQAEEVNKAADQIAGGWAEAMFNQITGKGGSIKNWFKGLFKQIATDALKNKIALPIVTGVMGGAMGALGGGLLGAAAAPATPGAAPAPGGGILSGLSGILDGFEKGITDLGAKLFGAAGANGAAGTSGLFGSGGQLFGSTGLANGVSGAFAGAGLGATAAGLLGALGLGKGNTKGGAIGGAIGGAAGSIFGPLGTTVGSLLGGAIGSLFGGKPSNKEGSATIDLNSGNVAVGGFTGKKFSQENRDQASGIAGEVLKIKDALEKGFGARITGTLAVGAGDRDGLFATALNSSARTSFKDDKAGAEQLLAYVTGQFVTAIRDQLSPAMSAALGRVDFKEMEKALGDLEFIRSFEDSITALGEGMGVVNQVTREAKAEVDEQIRSLKDFKEKTARLFPDDVDRAATAMRAYVEELVGITDAAEPMSQVETALMALQARFEAYKPLLEEVGYTAEQAQAAIANGLQKAKDKLKDEFNGTQTRTLREATGQGYLNQVDDLKKGLDSGLRDAAAVGGDAGLVRQSVTAQLEALLGNGNLDVSQLQGVISQFGTDFPEAAAVAQQAMQGLIDRSGEIARLNQGFADRQFTATTDTGTKAGALAAFDRQAAAERLEIARKAGADLAAYDRAVAAERLRIEKDFNDRLAATNLSIQDRLFAATTDTATQAGALATLNRKAAQERLELEKLAGADLVAFDAAVAAERLRIQQDFAERTNAANQTIQDRLFAATNDTATQTGALAAFDRQTAKERVELARVAGADMVAFDAAVAAERLRIQQDFAERTNAANQTIADRLFAATNDTATQTGALAAFDRQTAKERADLARVAGADLVGFDRAVAIERLRIQQDFADRTNATNLSIQDRLFAASNDTATLSGALAAFDRKTAQERAEIAKTAGADLVSFDLAIAAERLRIEKDFAERLAATNRSIQDRLFAATNDTATLSGALAAFDRKTAQERAEIVKTAGADLVSFDKAIAAERLSIQRQFAEQAAALNRGFADRLFAATNDADTLSGALAAFDRQAARERLDAARTSGADLALLEQALGAERARIIRDFNDKAIETAQAAADAARDRLVQAYEREADAARALASSWREAGDGIRAALKADSLSDPYTNLNADQRASLAERELRDLAARAGDSSLPADERLAAAQALPAARRAFLDAVRPLYEGTERWGQALDLSAQLLDGVALSASREVDIAQQQVDLAQQQLTALGVVNQSVLTVAQALADYQAAQAQVAAARAAAQTVAPSPASPAGVPANSNQPALTLDRVRGDLLSTPFSTHDLDGTAIARFTGPNGNSISLLASDLQTRPVEYLAEMARQLGLAGYQQGGVVGNGLRGVDSVLARYQDGGLIGLAGGEFVTRAAAVTAETLPFLRAINDSGRPPPILSGVADTSRLERLLQDLLTQTASTGRSMADLNARGYEALVNRLEGLLSQGQDQAADRRRVAR
ncbi:MAG: hypothetical protein ACT6Q8_18660 [Niveispirillum sp.]|uniref:hypothetical protein n=1 Tax=Niveispirillum sp. TaxID=1917217 RepID=UPI004035EAC7